MSQWYFTHQKTERKLTLPYPKCLDNKSSTTQRETNLTAGAFPSVYHQGAKILIQNQNHYSNIFLVFSRVQKGEQPPLKRYLADQFSVEALTNVICEANLKLAQLETR